MKVWFLGLGEPRLPYGTPGKRLRKGLKRSLVDFGDRGQFRVPNSWLSASRPNSVLGAAGKLALEILSVPGGER